MVDLNYYNNSTATSTTTSTSTNDDVVTTTTTPTTDCNLVCLEVVNKNNNKNNINSSTNNKLNNNNNKADDDTASTLSTSIEDKIVTFCEPLVTNVYTRPRTTYEDKYYLHYNEHDYIDFKIEYMTGKVRNRKVSFARDVVTDTYDYYYDVSLRDDYKHNMYYSQSELQEFLDEFVQSLNSKLS